MKLLILGHNGMLGHMVKKYMVLNNVSVEVCDYRWPSEEFKDFIKKSKCDYLLNCIACISHKKTNWDEYKSVNIDLPIFLSDNFNGKILHPSSDGEFKGDINQDMYYYKCDLPTAIDDYGISKAYSSIVLKTKLNVKQIRTSIIGPELKNNISLMEWFFTQTNNIKGYSNHYWNGITTLEWAKQAYKLILNWDVVNDTVIQIGSNKISKYQLLCLINKIFDCNKTIVSINVEPINRCLHSDFNIKNIEEQLIELNDLYYENKFHSTKQK